MRWLKVLGVLLAFFALLLIGLFLFARSFAPEKRDGRVIAAELEAEIAAIEATRRLRPPLFDETAPGTAWSYYRRAMDLFDQVRESLPEAAEAFEEIADPGNPDAEVPSTVRDLLSALEPAFALVRQGACTAESGRFFSPRAGIVESEIVHRAFPFAQDLKKKTIVRANLLAPDDPQGAVDALLVLERFGEDFDPGGGALHYLVGVTIQAAATSALAELIGAGLVPEDQMERVLQWVMARSQQSPDLLEVADRESLFARVCYQQILTGEAETTDFDLDGLEDADREKLEDLFYRVMDVYAGAYKRAREREHENGVAAVGLAFQEEVTRRATWMLASMELTAGTIVIASSRMFSMAYGKLDQGPTRLLAYRTALMLTIHARRFLLREGRFPISIDEILQFADREFPGAELLYYRPERPGESPPAFFLLEQVEEQGEDSAPTIATLRKAE